MYKGRIEDLEKFKKQLSVSNEVLGGLKKTSAITKIINANNKQIKLIENEYNIK